MATPGILLIVESPSPRTGAASSTWLQSAITPALQSGLPVFVVLGASNPAWERSLDQSGIDWGVCPDSMLGAAYMVAFGVHSNQHWNGWIIDTLGNPTSNPDHYRHLAEGLKHQEGSGECCSSCHYPIALSRCHAFELVRPWQPLDYLSPWSAMAAHKSYRH
ncbi:hypothetical protein [Parathalassolituus penaei]|uniref:Uncharacterized protein n=1 Tax=Parathalassolituus penaei TaxID=2997323 RepID=A0A9X3IQK4_9GAMM|nr:hypothetical protein [Parathalassolituus penaei]MCY0963891.1 hypothetical protein [Parathalassolituus penaei]